MDKYNIRPIPLFRGTRDKSVYTYRLHAGQRTPTTHYVWYIEGAKEGILVDCGSNSEQYRKRGLADEQVQSIEDGLNRLGLRVDDIKRVILTHLHWDHVVMAPKFSNATFFVQRREYDFAINPHPAAASSYEKRNSLVNLNLELLEGDGHIIDGVRVLLTPGHTPGGQSVAIDTPAGLAFITGFCCSLENFSPPMEVLSRGMEVVPPGIHTDVLAAYDSVLKVKQMADIIIPLHEPKFTEMDRIP